MTREEAITRIKGWTLDSDEREILAVIIPELAESEDERTRKEIIEFIRSQIEDGNSVGWDRWIAYLEKQKERGQGWSEDDEDKVEDIIWSLECLKDWIRKYDTDAKHNPSFARIDKEIVWLKSLRSCPMVSVNWEPGEDELGKKHLEGYIMGREDTMREMHDFLESHFNMQSATSTLKADG